MIHVPQITRPQQSSRRSCAMGFSVFSSYSGGIAERSAAQVQHAKYDILSRGKCVSMLEMRRKTSDDLSRYNTVDRIWYTVEEDGRHLHLLMTLAFDFISEKSGLRVLAPRLPNPLDLISLVEPTNFCSRHNLIQFSTPNHYYNQHD